MNGKTSTLMWLILISLLLCGTMVFGQVSKSPTFCWMVLSKENKTPSFIFGTVHHLGPQPVLDNKMLMSFILKSKVIVQEADTNELLHPGDEQFSYGSDIPLDSLLNPEDFALVKREFKLTTGKDLDRYTYVMPQMIMIMIESARERNRKILKPRQPIMENALYAISRVKKIPIVGLETKKEMYELMIEKMSPKQQASLLMYDLKNQENFQGEDTMKCCFEKQDLNCFCNIDDMNSYTRPGDSAIIMNRNLLWLPKIKSHIAKGNVFIAVGAAHLCGEYGIISLLKKGGYIIAPLLTK